MCPHVATMGASSLRRDKKKKIEKKKQKREARVRNLETLEPSHSCSVFAAFIVPKM